MLLKDLRTPLVKEAREGVRILIHPSRRPCRGEDDEALTPRSNLVLEVTREGSLARARGTLETGAPL